MTTINVVFFGALKESLGRSELAFELSQDMTVQALREALAKQLSNTALLDEHIKASINFEFARMTDVVSLETANEVAFFPPVTGG